jgi:hypothetical protein
MKTTRNLDSLLDTARMNPPDERLLSRDEVSSMLDGQPFDRPSVPVSSTRINWRLAMVIPSLLVLAGVFFFGDIGAPDEPTASPSTAPATSPSPKRAESPRTGGGAQPIAPADRSATPAPRAVPVRSESRTSSSTTTVSTAPTDRVSEELARANAARVGSTADRELERAARATANASSIIDDVKARGGAPDKKPDLPSGGMVITKTDYDSAETAKMLVDRASDRKLDIGRLGYIELTPVEAKRLGIDVTDDGLFLYADDMQAMSIRPKKESSELIKLCDGKGPELTLKRYEMRIARSESKFESIELLPDATPLPIAPVIVVNQFRSELRSEGSTLIYFNDAPTLGHFDDRDIVSNGHYEMLYGASRASVPPEDRAAVQKHALLGRLVPVYFRLDDGLIEGTSIRKGAEICLWYAPTKEFLAALPERYRSSLESEISTIAQVVRENGTVEQACDRIAGKPSYLEVCRVSSGAVHAATTSPNPAHGSTTVGFNLAEARRVSLTLHDMNGRYLRHLVHEEERPAGDHRVDADLSNVSQGAYLVAVRTERGEQAVARLIVQ